MARLKIQCKKCSTIFYDWKSNERIYCSKSCASHTMFKKGQASWNKGKSLSEETKRKLSVSHTGKTRVKKRVDMVCSHCQKDYQVHPCHKETSKFCSHKCFTENRKATGIFKGRNTGRRSEEIRRKISAALQGKTLGEWSDYTTDEERKERMRFRKIMQKNIFERDNYTCQICDQYSGNLQVDHIKRWSDHPELRFDEGNCRTVCMACHYYITFKKKLPEGVVWGHNLSRRITS